ncbi:MULTISPECIES: cytochrome c1 [Oligella]|uniref:Cytochrome C n=1 Tax=Oligella urethralis DNF00040 TaxID=1401065 RepID=A0A095YS72_9BURK|nr:MULTISPECIES: cytochrome c1 [Oligella]AVL71771.1 cytochrome c1 [Oligella urethralis]KGF25250.1 cytochrome C [Oligella urethralis DNF00040]OFV50461.1 cytochrome C [Oligella sp. HMSC09E12]WOS38474.1 Ammonia monooxygenase gamma subunit [Oligella urethralis]SUA68773.1 Cytochrome c1 precursor [Oligella urethralis]
MLKKILSVLALTVAAVTSAGAATTGPAWDVMPVKVTDKAALQNGAKLFVNYCLNCHSANYVRYNKLMDLGLTEQQIEDNLLFTGERVGDMMHIALPAQDAKKWMGVTPPDLSVIARSRAANLGQPGTDYIYTYLRTFYRDQSSQTGWNNIVFPNAAMPNPLWRMQGPVEATITDIKSVEDGDTRKWVETVTKFDKDGFATLVSEKVLSDYKGGESSSAEITYLDESKREAFDKNMADLSAFLGWMAEPDQHFRKVLGTWVMLFLSLFFVVAWFLNKQYWKNVK